MKTTGDKILNQSLEKIGGKGLFVKELDKALLSGDTDLSVHSLKDVPMELPEELPLLAFSKREDPRDVLVLPEGKTEEIRETAAKIFSAMDGYGLSRVDFFLEKDTNEVIFNEINTMPGFTSISMYPMLWKAAGMDIEELIEKQIQLAYERRY